MTKKVADQIKEGLEEALEHVKAKRKSTVAWGIKGSNGLVHTITTRNSTVVEWQQAGMNVVELVERGEEPLPTMGEPADPTD